MAVRNIDLPLVIRRVGSDSTYLNFRLKDKQFLLDVFLKEKEKLRNDREALTAVNRGISVCCNEIAWNYLYSGRHKEAFSLYFQSFKETREPMMLLRAVSALIPLGPRSVIKKCRQGKVN
jgi:hypothetical protein